MMIFAVDKRDINWTARQFLGGRQPAKAAADNHNLKPFRFTLHMSSLPQSSPLDRCLSPGLSLADASAQAYCAYMPQGFFPNPAQTYLILLSMFSASYGSSKACPGLINSGHVGLGNAGSE